MAIIKSIYADKILEKHQFQGKSNDCGPFCIAMVNNALNGTDLKGEDIGQELNNWVWRGVVPVWRRINNWATLPWGMVDKFRELGYKSQWKLFQNAVYLKNGLEENKLIIPIIGEWKWPLGGTWAHFMVLVQHDPEMGWGFVNSAKPQKKFYWLSDAEFMEKWRWGNHMLVEAEPKNA